MIVVAAAVHGGYLPSNFRHLPLNTSSEKKGPSPQPPPPLHISTKPTHVNLHHLKDLYALCNLSCHRFPNFDSHGRVEPIDVNKLRTALSHSSVVVSVFTRPEYTYQSATTPQVSRSMGIGGDWIRRLLMPVTPENGQLVGFGRAISDLGCTASIFDVMVIPSLQGRGIGRMIVQRIVRMLTNRGVDDISAICSEKERLFFRACGFGNDILCSTTMMYTRTASSSSSCTDGDQMVTYAGRKPLLVPPLGEQLLS